MPTPGEETVTLTQAEIAELTKRAEDAEALAAAKASEAEQATRLAQENEAKLNGTVEELKKLREKRDPALTPDTDKPQDVTAAVNAALEAQRKKDAEANRDIAIARFQEANKDFHKDNDPGGIKLKAILDEFGTFDNSGLFSVEEFTGRLDKAKRLVVGDTKPGDVEQVRDDPSLQGGGTPPKPKSDTPNKLTAEERQVIKQIGWTEERFLKAKESNPDYVRSLFA